MTTTLSQRLRDLREHLPTFGAMDGSVWIPLDDAIAQAEATEGQAGELSDEEIERIVNEHADRYGQGRPSDLDASGPFVERARGVGVGLEYARDHGYLKPSQAIGEQTPVAWMGDNVQPITATLRNTYEHAEHPILVHYDIPLYRSPLSPEARDRAIEAGNAMSRILAVTYSTMPYDIRKLIARWDQALSALRGE